MSEQAATPVVPSFWVDAVEPLRDFYIEQLGFAHMMGVVGKDGNLEFAIVQREALMVMMGRPPQPLEGSSTDGGPDRLVELYLYVTDIDGYYEELRSRNVGRPQLLREGSLRLHALVLPDGGPAGAAGGRHHDLRRRRGSESETP